MTTRRRPRRRAPTNPRSVDTAGAVSGEDAAAMKLIVDQADDNMGLQSTQTLGPILDGVMRNTPEGRDFVRVSATEGVRGVIERRDGPFGDDSQAPADEQPSKRARPD